MNILHTSDWHLGKKLDNYSRFDEQCAVLDEIISISEKEKSDMVIIAGDIFDTFNPPTEATELFYRTVKKLSRNGTCPVIVIAGNHDSPDRIEAPDSLAFENGIFFLGYPDSKLKKNIIDSGVEIVKAEEGFTEIKLPSSGYSIGIIHTPYANELRLQTALGREDEEISSVLSSKWNKYADTFDHNSGVLILASHLMFFKDGETIPEEPDDEKPILHIGGARAISTSAIPSSVKYTALGHLHRMQNIGSAGFPVYYSGSPLAYSFSESNQDKYVMLVRLEPGKAAEVEPVKLTTAKRLVRLKAESIEEALELLRKNENNIVELTVSTDSFLNAEERRTLYSNHNALISVIPEIRNKELLKITGREIDLTQNRLSLFSDYFKTRTGQEISPELLDLFKEIIATEENV